MAEEIGPEEGLIQVQGNRYEGLVVWANQMIASAGTEILAAPTQIELEQEPTERALAIMGKLSTSSRRRPEPDHLRRGHRPARLRVGQLGLHDQLPVRLSERRGRGAGHLQEDEGGALPAGRPEDRRARRRSAASTSASPPSRRTRTSPSRRSSAWSSPRTSSRSPAPGGLPPVREDLYDAKEIEKVYPGFAPLIRESIDAAVAAPLAVARLPGHLAGDPARDPPDDRDRPRGSRGRPTTTCARTLEHAIKREGLL